MQGNNEVVVVGLNATGRVITTLLAVAGEATLNLIDEEIVSKDSYPQGYSVVDLGMSKAAAVKEAILEVNKDAKINIFTSIDSAKEYLGSKLTQVTLFCCKPISSKAKLHLLKSLDNSCSSMYFCAFEADGNYKIAHWPTLDLGNSVVASLGSGVENIAKAKTAGVELFVRHQTDSQ